MNNHILQKQLIFINELSREFLCASQAAERQTRLQLTRPYPGMINSLLESFDARLAYSAASLQFI